MKKILLIAMVLCVSGFASAQDFTAGVNYSNDENIVAGWFTVDADTTSEYSANLWSPSDLYFEIGMESTGSLDKFQIGFGPVWTLKNGLSIWTSFGFVIVDNTNDEVYYSSGGVMFESSALPDNVIFTAGYNSQIGSVVGIGGNF